MTIQEILQRYRYGEAEKVPSYRKDAAAFSEQEWYDAIDGIKERWLANKFGSDSEMKSAAIQAPTLPLRLYALGYLKKNEYAYGDAMEVLLAVDPQDTDSLWKQFIESHPGRGSTSTGLLLGKFADNKNTSEQTKRDMLDTFGTENYVMDTLARNPTTPPGMLGEIFDRALAVKDPYDTGRGWNVLSHLASNKALPQDLAEKLWAAAKVKGADNGVLGLGHHGQARVTKLLGESLSKNPVVPEHIRKRAGWMTALPPAEAIQAWNENPSDEDRSILAKRLPQGFALEQAQDPTLPAHIRAILVRDGVAYKDRTKVVEASPDLQTRAALSVICSSGYRPMPGGIVRMAAKVLDPVEDKLALNRQLTMHRDYGQNFSDQEQADIANLLGRSAVARFGPEDYDKETDQADLAEWAAARATDPEALRFTPGINSRLDANVIQNTHVHPDHLAKIFHTVKNLRYSDTYHDGDSVLSSVAGAEHAPASLLNEIARSGIGVLDRVLAENPSTPVDTLQHLARTNGVHVASRALKNPSMPEEERRKVLDAYLDQEEAAFKEDRSARPPAVQQHIAYGLLENFRAAAGYNPDDDDNYGAARQFIAPETLRHVYDRVANMDSGSPARNVLTQTATRDLLQKIVLHNHATPEMMQDYMDRHEAFGKSVRSGVARGLLMHPNVSVDLLKRLGKHSDHYVAEEAKERLNELLAEIDPDQIYEEHVKVKFGTNKMRMLRDKIGELGGDEAKPSQLPKELVQAIGSNGRLPNGNYSARLLQRLIDDAPSTHLNISHGDWDGAQRHSDVSSKVLQVNASSAQIQAMRDAGVYDTYKKLCEFTSEAHPVKKEGGIGWIRYTGDKTGLHIDELQSDMGQGFSKQFDSAVDSAVAQGQMTKEEGEAKKAEIAKKFPKPHMEAIEKILFQGKHSSEFLFEAFLEWARTAKVDGAANPDKGKMESLIGTPVHVWDVVGKAPLSGWDLSKPLPKHGLVGYREAPKKAGFKPSEYGSIPTQDNPEHKQNPSNQAIFPDDPPLPAKPTWAEEIRKHEELEALLKADPKVWAAGDFKVPHKDHPSRKQFDENYRKRLEEFFITPNFDRFVERTVPIEKLIGGHDVPSSNNPAKTKLYTKMYAAGDPGLPMVVSPGTNGHYHIVDGNRRLLAAQAAGVRQLKVLSKEKIGGRVRKSEEDPLLKTEGPKLPDTVQKTFNAVRNALSDELMKPEYRGHPNKFRGHCYVASEALHHLLGGSEAGWVPQFIRWEGAPHWYLKHPATDTILDLTAEQFSKPVPYEQGSGKGFLTSHPSKRAQVLIDRVKEPGNL